MEIVHSGWMNKYGLSAGIAGIILSPFILMLISLFLGQYSLDPVTVLIILFSPVFHPEPTWTGSSKCYL